MSDAAIRTRTPQQQTGRSAVELDEAVQRIFKHHAVLVSLLALLGLAVPLLLEPTRAAQYLASTRVVLGAGDTTSGQESNALADTALGIVTSRGVVEQGLETARARRDPFEVATTAVEVKPVGTSGVLQLTVTDTDPRVAADLANALSARLVALRNESLSGPSERLLSDVTQRIEAAARGATTEVSAGLTPSAQAAEQLRQRSALIAQRDRLVESLAAVPRAAVIDPAVPATAAAPSGTVPRLALGGILGLLCGVALAALREVLRPSLGPESLARHLDAPVLGRLPAPLRSDTDSCDPHLAGYVALAASHARVSSALLIPVGPPVDATGLAQCLRAESGTHVDVLVLGSPARGAGASGREWSRERTDGAVGVIVVAPSVVRRADLADLEQFCAVTKRPVLGIITYRRTAAWRARPEPAHDKPVTVAPATELPVRSMPAS